MPLQCTTVSGGGHQHRPPLKPILIKRPFQKIGVDIMDLPCTERANKHVVVFQDMFARWPLVFAVPDQRAERIARLLCEEVVPMFSVPEALLSDRGTNLLSHLMTDTCHQLRVKPCPRGFTAGYYWYGSKRKGPGRLPRWVRDVLTGQDSFDPHNSLAEQSVTVLDSTSVSSAFPAGDIYPCWNSTATPWIAPGGGVH